MSGFCWVSSSKNCSSVGFNMAGACTSGEAHRVSDGGRPAQIAKPGFTFANPLHRADLSPIFQHVDGEVDLGARFLLLDCADGIVDLLGNTVVTRHAGRGVHVHFESLALRTRPKTKTGPTRGEISGSAIAMSQVCPTSGVGMGCGIRVPRQWTLRR